MVDPHIRAHDSRICGWPTGRNPVERCLRGQHTAGFVVFFVATLVTIKIIPTVWFGVDLAPDAIFGALASAAPVFGPLVNFTTGYLESFIATIQGTAGIRLDFYILGIAFAYVGGAMALQSLREMEYLVKHGGDHGMHVHVGDPKSKGKKGLWIFGKHDAKAKAVDTEEEEDGPRRDPIHPFQMT